MSVSAQRSGKASIDAFRLLKTYHDGGKILVTKTSRLLRYNLALDHLAFTEAQTNGQTIIDITAIKDTQFGDFTPTINDLRGITFYVPDSSKAEIRIHDVKVRSPKSEETPLTRPGSKASALNGSNPTTLTIQRGHYPTLSVLLGRKTITGNGVVE
jgi:hypothetical protein